MFGTIRKHSKWMWGIVVTATILSFVVFFSPSGRMGSGVQRDRYNFGSIDGHKISLEDYSRARMGVYLNYLFSHGSYPDADPQAKRNGFDEQREIYFRLLLLTKARDLGIHVSSDTAARAALNLIRDAGFTSPQTFEQRVLGRLSLADMGIVLEHDLAIQQLAALVGMPGKLITPQEAQMLWRFDNQEVSADLVYLPASNYLSSVTITPMALEQFFTNQATRYRVPARVQVNYVEFAVTNFLSLAEQAFATRVTNAAEYAEMVYNQAGSNKFGGRPLAEVRESILTETKRNLAREFARTNAAALHVEITDVERVSAGDLAKMAAKAGLPVRLSPPVDQESGAALMPGAFVQKAFTLNNEEPVSAPVVTEDSVFVLALATNIPSYIPSFTVVSNRVRYDYLQMTASQLARATGERLHQAFTEGLARGEKFAAIASANQVRPTALAPFSRTTRTLADLPPQIPLGLLQEAAFKVPAGRVSEFVPLTAGGFLLYVKELLPLDEKKAQDELPKLLTQLRQASQNDAFQAWIRKQSEAGLRDTPLARQQSPNLGAPGAN